MSNEAKNLPVHEMDTNILFEKFTVEEIRDIEKRTRSDIERKKEDLRTMVGERYRDLIEAADTITEMKNSAQNVTATIGRIESLCSTLKQAQMIKGSSLHQKRQAEMDNKRKEEARFYGVASQIKLLLGIPEKIWTCLDCEDYLTASRLYLLSQHINTSLHLDSQHAPNFLYWFPVLNRQWAAISHFKFTILQGCRKLLKEPSVPDQKIAESLCSILLLESSNPRQVFNEFLLARTSAVQQLFHINNQSSSTKEQICTVVRLITTTIHQIHAVFYGSQDDQGQDSSDHMNLLLKILTKVTSQKQHESGLLDLHSSVSARCLPKSVTDFCPSHKSVSLGVSEQHLHDNCKQWIQTCTSDVKTGVSKLLGFVNTIKHLATVRDTVWDLMSNDSSLEDWDAVCKRVINGSLYIWDDLLRPLFIDRVKSLIQYQLETTVQLTQRQIGQVVMELNTPDNSSLYAEVNLASYIWSESASDIAANTAWGLTGSRSLVDSGGLMMKAKAFTPVVQSLCKNFDERLASMSDDYTFYMFPDNDDVTMVTKDSNKPFNRYADTTQLLTFVQESCVNGIKGIVAYLTDLLNECKKVLSTAEKRCSIIGNKLLLTGRMCAAICVLTPHLQQCIVGMEQKQDGRLMKRSVSGRLPSKSDVCTVWEDTKTQLAGYQQDAYRTWIDHIVKIVLRDFTLAVNTQKPSDLVRTNARWDEVCIEEETEEGKKITSKISVPMQASWYLLSLLYSLCSDLNQIGGHAVARSVLEHLVVTISDGIVGVYSGLLTTQSLDPDTPGCINQHRALQLLFDVKFVSMIIPRKDDTKGSKTYHQQLQSIVCKLEETIDPFDLDVFSPYIQANLNKLTQRSAVLLGGLTSLDRSSVYGLTSRPSSSTQQEQHNVLQLSTCQSRFSLLPLSTQQSRYSEPQPVVTQSLYRGVDTGGPSLTESAAAVLPHNASHKMAASSSFYDKIGTGLGSMTEISNWFSTIGQNLCKNFDERLASMSDDYTFYMFPDNDDVTMVTKDSNKPFNRYADTTQLLTFVQESCVNGIKGIVAYLTDLLNECKKVLSTAEKRCSIIGNKLLLTGRMCAAICVLTPHLQQCIVGMEQKQDGRLMKRSVSGRLPSKSDVCTVWEDTKTQLAGYQQDAYRTWIDHIVKIVLRDFTLAVNTQKPSDLVRTNARWDEVCIEEETEEGKKITSKISVPMQASWYLLSLLYSLCSDLNQIGGHAVARSVLEHLVVTISDGIVGVYSGLLTTQSLDPDTPGCINQHRALQLLFDVKFVSMIIPRKDDTKGSKTYHQQLQSIVCKLEETIDPFDLDVFSPYIQANLNKLTQRSAVLLGGLTSLDRSSVYGLTSRPSSSTQQEQHNVLQLSTCQSRFSLLPLSTQQSRYSEPQPVVTQSLYRGVDTGGPSLTESAAAVLPHNASHKMAASSSFYDKIGTGLGSMTEISNWFSTIGQK